MSEIDVFSIWYFIAGPVTSRRRYTPTITAYPGEVLCRNQPQFAPCANDRTVRAAAGKVVGSIADAFSLHTRSRPPPCFLVRHRRGQITFSSESSVSYRRSRLRDTFVWCQHRRDDIAINVGVRLLVRGCLVSAPVETGRHFHASCVEVPFGHTRRCRYHFGLANAAITGAFASISHKCPDWLLSSTAVTFWFPASRAIFLLLITLGEDTTIFISWDSRLIQFISTTSI